MKRSKNKILKVLLINRFHKSKYNLYIRLKIHELDSDHSRNMGLSNVCKGCKFHNGCRERIFYECNTNERGLVTSVT